MDETFSRDDQEASTTPAGDPETVAILGDRDWLLRHADWQTIAHRYVHRGQDESGEDDQFAGLLGLSAMSDTGLLGLDPADTGPQLRQWRERLSEQQLLVQNSTDDGEHELGVLEPESISDWIQQTSLAIRFVDNTERATALRQGLHDLTRIDSPLYHLRLVTAWLGEQNEQGKRVVPLPIHHALMAESRALIGAFDADDQARAAERAHRGLPRPRVSGGEVLLPTTRIDDVPSWTTQQLARMPSWFSDGLQAVEYVAEDTAGEALGRNLAGHYDAETRTAVVSAEVATFENRQAALDGIVSQEDIYQIHAEHVGGKVVHETAHHAWRFTLGIAQLRDWLAVRQRERVLVTPYVVDKARSNDPMLEEEDFCESVRLYAYEPDRLAGMAPERFQYMRQLLQPDNA